MPCLNFHKIKGANPAAPKRFFIPCGVCRDCLNQARNSWSFRLSLALDAARRKGYSVGFITLTYRRFPILPKKCFCDPMDYRPVPCFSRSHIKSLIHHLQDKIYDSPARGSSFQYLVSSELGKSTHRPHYHMVCTIPPGIEPSLFHDWILKYWYRKHGFVIPATYLGKAGHNGFLVDAPVRGVASYCSKYCTKDLDFEWSLDNLMLNRKCKAFKYARPFHSQSRSLGYEFIDGLDDHCKLDLLFNGYAFLGEDKFSALPLYLRNKILFDPVYLKHEKTKKRLVRRKPSEFFARNYRKVFERKARYYEKVLNDCSQLTWYLSHGILRSDAELYSSTVRGLRVACDKPASVLAADYLAFFGIPREYSFDADRADVWFNRYLNEPRIYGKIIDQSYFANVARLFAYCFSTLKFSDVVPTLDPELVDYVADFHKSNEV